MERNLEEVKSLLKDSMNLELQGKYKEAINLLEKAVKLNPEDGNIYNRLGDLYLKLNKTKDAINAYQQGIEAFKINSFLRNALALCKKILRYDPGNTEINFTIAQLLIDLDEKGDAAMYLFSYIERQMAAGNKKEVMRAMEILKSLKLGDTGVADKMATIYDKVGEKKRASEIKQETKAPEIKEIPTINITTQEVKPLSEAPHLPIDKSVEQLTKAIDTETVNRLKELSGELENIVAELRRAMRIDEVVIAVDKSINIFSQQQKETINLLNKSLQTNLEALKRAVSEFQNDSKRNLDHLLKIIYELNRSITEINKNQNFFVNETVRNLKDIGDRFESTTAKMLEDLCNLTNCYESTSKDVCTKVEDSRQITSSLLKVSSETKLSIQTINESLLKYFLSQDIQIKKLNKFIFFTIILLGGIAVLLLFILLLK
ncbi:MAG: tetratricopeptide repeat protein [candidate division WOR-3 bacterium]